AAAALEISADCATASISSDLFITVNPLGVVLTDNPTSGAGAAAPALEAGRLWSRACAYPSFPPGTEQAPRMLWNAGLSTPPKHGRSARPALSSSAKPAGRVSDLPAVQVIARC